MNCNSLYLTPYNNKTIVSPYKTLLTIDRQNNVNKCLINTCIFRLYDIYK